MISKEMNIAINNLEILHAVTALEYHDKNLLAQDDDKRNRIKVELINNTLGQLRAELRKEKV